VQPSFSDEEGVMLDTDTLVCAPQSKNNEESTTYSIKVLADLDIITTRCVGFDDGMDS
jgi:hypothetical protein